MFFIVVVRFFPIYHLHLVILSVDFYIFHLSFTVTAVLVCSKIINILLSVLSIIEVILGCFSIILLLYWFKPQFRILRFILPYVFFYIFMIIVNKHNFHRTYLALFVLSSNNLFDFEFFQQK